MTIYPELLLEMAYDRQRALVAEADRGRVLKSARQWARAERAASARRDAAAQTASRTSQRPAAATVVSTARDGNVAACGPRAVAPAGR